jgi:hypothetical protein
MRPLLLCGFGAVTFSAPVPAAAAAWPGEETGLGGSLARGALSLVARGAAALARRAAGQAVGPGLARELLLNSGQLEEQFSQLTPGDRLELAGEITKDFLRWEVPRSVVVLPFTLARDIVTSDTARDVASLLGAVGRDLVDRTGKAILS